MDTSDEFPIKDRGDTAPKVSIRPYRRGRYWAVYVDDALVCVCVYQKGAAEVVRLIKQAAHPEHESNE